MDIQEMEITINKNGQVEVHVRGVKGEACLELTRELEQALGGQVILRQMTPEAEDGNAVSTGPVNIQGG